MGGLVTVVERVIDCHVGIGVCVSIDLLFIWFGSGWLPCY
jgi:hypothetical protein